MDKKAATALRSWQKIREEQKKLNKEMTTLHESILPFISELHVIWVSSPQVYEICNLHHIPHYSLPFQKTITLLERLKPTKISSIEYFTDRNYLCHENEIRITNIFEKRNPFTDTELNPIFESMSLRTNNKYCTTVRGNKSVSGGWCSQVRCEHLTPTDKDYQGVLNCNRPHFTTTFAKMDLDVFFWTCAFRLSLYSQEFNSTRLGDKFRTVHSSGYNIYEGITIAILDLSSEVVHPHLDSFNDYRTAYNCCTVYSVIRGDLRLTFIGYAKKSMGDFSKRLQEGKNKICT